LANIKDILNYCKEAATANGYSYRLIRSVSDVNSITANQFPMIAVLPPPTESGYLEKGVHGFTVFVLDKLPMVTQDTTKNTNDRYHAKYKALDDAFYAWHTSLVNSNSGQSLFSNVGSDVTISRLRDGRTNEELLGIQVEFELVTTWYCNGTNPDIPTGGGGSCDPATILNADGSSYTTVASGGTLQLSGVNVAGQTPATGVKNDGTTFTVSGVTISGNTPATGVQQDGTTFTVSGVTVSGQTPSTGVKNDGTTFTVSGVTVTGQTPSTGVQQDGSTFTVSGVTISGNTPATGTQQDGSVFSVSGVTISGNTPATGVQQDGSTFSVSGVTVNDDGTSTTYDDGTTVNIFRNGWSVLLDGINQYAEVNTTDFNFGYSDAFSVEFWVKNSSIQSAVYICNFDTSPQNGWRVLRGGTGANRGGIRFHIADAGSFNYDIQTTSTSLLTAGLWHHVVVTKPANNTAANARIYVDGVSVSTSVLSTGGTATPAFLDKLTVGWNSDGAGNTADAYFDCITIYNRELLAVEALTHYNNGRPNDRSNDSGLVGYWRFENDFTDELGNNDLTGFNSPVFSRQRP